MCAERRSLAASTGANRSTGGTHVYKQDPRNADILVGMRDGVSGRFSLVWRPHAKVSVLDSGFMLGDGVWEGVRLHQGVLMFAQARRLCPLFDVFCLNAPNAIAAGKARLRLERLIKCTLYAWLPCGS